MVPKNEDAKEELWGCIGVAFIRGLASHVKKEHSYELMDRGVVDRACAL